MEIEKLIDDLRWWAEHCDRTNFGCQTGNILKEAASALSTLQAENAKLKEKALDARLEGYAQGIGEMNAELEKVKAERDEIFCLLEDTCKAVREKSAEDYVCGLCECDGAYIGESGDWLNECPGFERDDCFCMKKSLRERFRQKED